MPPSPALASSEVAQESPARAEVLDAGDEAGGEQLEGALDQQLLHERVADLHARPLRRAVGVEGLAMARMDAPPIPSPPVAAPYRITLLPAPGGLGQVQVLVPQHADAEGVDQRVAGVGGVEDTSPPMLGRPRQLP